MPLEGEQLAAAGRLPHLRRAIRTPVASRVPSGDQDTVRTTLVCPLRVSSSRPPAASHTFAVPSSPPVASRVPSGDQDTDQTPP